MRTAKAVVRHKAVLAELVKLAVLWEVTSVCECVVRARGVEQRQRGP